MLRLLFKQLDEAKDYFYSIKEQKRSNMSKETQLSDALESISDKASLMNKVSEYMPSLPKAQVDYIVTLYADKLITKQLAIDELINYS